MYESESLGPLDELISDCTSGCTAAINCGSPEEPVLAGPALRLLWLLELNVVVESERHLAAARLDA